LKNNKGFTLLEILVSISLIAIVFVSIFRLQAQTIRMNDDARFFTTAPLLARSKMVEIDIAQMTIKELAGSSGDFGEEFGGFQWSLAVEKVDSEFLEAAAVELFRIELAVYYKDQGYLYKLRTYRLSGT